MRLLTTLNSFVFIDLTTVKIGISGCVEVCVCEACGGIIAESDGKIKCYSLVGEYNKPEGGYWRMVAQYVRNLVRHVIYFLPL